MTEQNTPQMTHDDMIYLLKGMVFGTFDRTTPEERVALNMAIETLEQEPKTGHWIDAIEPIPLEERNAKLGFTYKIAGYKCSECGAKHEEHRLSMIATKTNYCPNCGAKME